jgi:hypothetical protein
VVGLGRSLLAFAACLRRSLAVLGLWLLASVDRPWRIIVDRVLCWIFGSGLRSIPAYVCRLRVAVGFWWLASVVHCCHSPTAWCGWRVVVGFGRSLFAFVDRFLQLAFGGWLRSIAVFMQRSLAAFGVWWLASVDHFLLLPIACCGWCVVVGFGRSPFAFVDRFLRLAFGGWLRSIAIFIK